MNSKLYNLYIAAKRLYNSLKPTEIWDIKNNIEVQPGVWRLESYEKKVFYDFTSDQYIKSIGQHRETGNIFASIDLRYQNNPLFITLYEP